MNKFNLKVGQILGDYRVVSVGEEGAFIVHKRSEAISEPVFWFTNDEIQTKFNLKKEKWVPKQGEKYYRIDSTMEVRTDCFDVRSWSDALHLSNGNVFATEAEALSKAEEIRKVLMK